MNQYVQVILTAAVAFPVLAAVITLPYLIYNYRKHGSVLSLRVPIIYSFVLYLLCCYLLVILPLPSQEYVAKLTGPGVQLIPFTFVADIINNAHLASVGGWDDAIRSILTNKAFYQVIMNVLMFIPLGIYLRYYFGFSKRKTIACAFLLSLFFELTQLSGLYFIYPRGYRLFDVDDLMINTLGGVIGCLLATPLGKVLPTKAEMDQASYRRSHKVSLLRRLVALFCDFVAMFAIGVLIGMVLRIFGLHMPDLGFASTSGLIFIGYFGVLPIFTNSQTIGHKLTRLKVMRAAGGPARWYQHLGRVASVLLIFIVVPYLLMALDYWLLQEDMISVEGAVVVGLVIVAGYAFFILFELIRAAMRKSLFYERWTKTKVISTTSIKTEAGEDSNPHRQPTTATSPKREARKMRWLQLHPRE